MIFDLFLIIMFVGEIEEKEASINAIQVDEKEIEKPIDYEKLAYAVAVAESGNCTAGQSRYNNNCHSIMTWKSGTRELKKFDTKRDSYNEFIWMWKKSYGRYPDEELAKKYICGPRAKTCKASKHWLANVDRIYNRK